MRLAVKALIPYNAICDMSDMGNIFFPLCRKRNTMFIQKY